MSDSIKLIIEIPKIDKELLDSGLCGETRKEAILHAVKIGTPLDSIKAEIKEHRDSWEKDGYHDEADALNIALEIIDEHIGKVENEED